MRIALGSIWKFKNFEYKYKVESFLCIQIMEKKHHSFNFEILTVIVGVFVHFKQRLSVDLAVDQ